MVTRIGILVQHEDPARGGGDDVQMRAIAKFLTSNGVDVEVQSLGRFDPRNWDWAIISNLGLAHRAGVAAERCRTASVPFVLFPIFWDLRSIVPRSEQRLYSRVLPLDSRRLRMASQLKYLLAGRPEVSWRSSLRSERQTMRKVLAQAQVICPNSYAESEHLAEYAGVGPDERWAVVRNGIWSEAIPEGAPWGDRAAEVLVLGNLCPRKNSLRLVRAAKAFEVPLRLVGYRRGTTLDRYSELVLSECGPLTTFVEQVSHAEALRLLSEARAHAQVSFLETPGLATLEAAAAGASVVASASPVVREYLPAGTRLVRPESLGDIGRQLRAALDEPPDADFAKWVREDLHWNRVLEPLLALLGIRKQVTGP